MLWLRVFVVINFSMCLMDHWNWKFYEISRKIEEIYRSTNRKKCLKSCQKVRIICHPTANVNKKKVLFGDCRRFGTEKKNIQKLSSEWCREAVSSHARYEGKNSSRQTQKIVHFSLKACLFFRALVFAQSTWQNYVWKMFWIFLRLPFIARISFWWEAIRQFSRGCLISHSVLEWLSSWYQIIVFSNIKRKISTL